MKDKDIQQIMSDSFVLVCSVLYKKPPYRKIVIDVGEPMSIEQVKEFRESLFFPKKGDRENEKTRAQKIRKALDDLSKAMELEEPNICLFLPYGLDSRTEAGKEFTVAVKTFVQAYKKYHGMEKIEVDFVL